MIKMTAGLIAALLVVCGLTAGGIFLSFDVSPRVYPEHDWMAHSVHINYINYLEEDADEEIPLVFRRMVDLGELKISYWGFEKIYETNFDFGFPFEFATMRVLSAYYDGQVEYNLEVTVCPPEVVPGHTPSNPAQISVTFDTPLEQRGSEQFTSMFYWASYIVPIPL